MSAALTIGIVDDDCSVRKALARLLQIEGFTVKQYCSADEFIARDAGSGVACLLIDVRMPGFTGLDLCEYLTEAGSALPMVLMTGDADPMTQGRAATLGAASLLVKPIDAQLLLRTLYSVLSPVGARSPRIDSATDNGSSS